MRRCAKKEWLPVPDKKVLIIGGGVTGLTAAHRLCRERGLTITLVESSRDLGGLAAGFPLLGTRLEKAYHHLFLTDTHALALIEELGLSGKMMWCESSVGVCLGGRIYPFTTPLDLLRFKPCGLLGRLRFGVVALYLQKRSHWRPLVGNTAHDWMARACGKDVMRTIWTPLLKGKFDKYWDAVSMAWLWARIHSRASSRPRGGGGERLGYMSGGFAELINALEAELTRRGVRIRAGVSVKALQVASARCALLADGETVPFDQCLFTGPSPEFARLLPSGQAPAEYARKLASIVYLGAICLIFASDQSISEQYWLNIHEAGAPFLVFIHHTRLVGTELYQGKHVYYIGCYKPQDSPLFSLNDDELAKLWFGYLKSIFPHFDPARVSERHVFRLRAAQHIVDTAYEQKIPDYQTPVPGLFLANFSQIFPEDRGITYAVREGLKVAQLMHPA